MDKMQVWTNLCQRLYLMIRKSLICLILKKKFQIRTKKLGKIKKKKSILIQSCIQILLGHLILILRSIKNRKNEREKLKKLK